MKNSYQLFRIFALFLKIPDEIKLHPRHSTKFCYTPEGLKPRHLEIPHDVFLITPKNATLFLNNPWKFYLLFLQYPWKFHILNHSSLVFSGIAHFNEVKSLKENARKFKQIFIIYWNPLAFSLHISLIVFIYLWK